MEKERIATKSLITLIKSEKNELDCYECVNESLGTENYLKIGKKAIKKELEILNNIPKNVGIKVERKGKYRTLNRNLDTGWKVAGWAILTLLTGSLGVLALVAVAGISDSLAEKKMEKLKRKMKLKENDFNENTAQEFLDANFLVFSLGAGGIRGKFIPGKFTCYIIQYPKYRFENMAAKKAFLEYMSKCKVVPNSMFCWIGSGKQYRDALNELEGKN